MPRDGSLLAALGDSASATRDHEVAALLDAARDLASPLDLRPVLEIRYPAAGFGPVWPRLCAGEPVIIPDVYAASPEARIRGPRTDRTAPWREA